MAGDRMAGAVAGALLAGLGITALLMADERRSGRPSELVEMERRGARRLGMRTRPMGTRPGAGEQAAVQGGHLLLSGLAGAAYGAVAEDDTNPLVGGAVFGLAFYALAHGVLGPLLGVKAPEWRQARSVVGMHVANHLAFGAVTALFARWGARGWRI